MSAFRLWQDREVRFDFLTATNIFSCPGEQIFECIEPVEDAKGNQGDPGRVLLTNLRIIWHSIGSPHLNLSIGFNTINTLTCKSVNNVNGPHEIVFILTKAKSSKFEFIFSPMKNAKLHNLITNVYKAYATSKLYRDIKLRSAIMENKQLRILTQEHICNQVEGVWNLSTDQGNLGSFILTNIRLVWYAAMNDLFNISIPYIQMSQITVKESKFGPALVIESTPWSGNFVVGFRIDPIDKIRTVCKEITAVRDIQLHNPILGTNYNTINSKNLAQPSPHLEQDDQYDFTEVSSDEFATYLAAGIRNEPKPPVYCAEIGLAIEQPPLGFSLQNLWYIFPQLNTRNRQEDSESKILSQF